MAFLTRTSLARFVDKNRIVQFLLIAVCVLGFQSLAFAIPPQVWLPAQGTSYLSTLWQVHASILGVAVVVVSIIITVIANETDRARTWTLYSEKTHFLHVIWANLVLTVSMALATLQILQAQVPLFSSDRAGNLVLFETVLFVVAMSLLVLLFTVTLNFLKDDYVEDLAERRIVEAMPEAVDRDIKRLQELNARLKG